jgi:hypothetical protein
MDDLALQVAEVDAATGEPSPPTPSTSTEEPSSFRWPAGPSSPRTMWRL